MQILVIRPGALGDVLLTLPAFQALQSAFPRARIDLMGDLPIIAWLPDRSVVHAAYSFERADLTALFQPVTVTSQSLQRFLAEFDVIVSYATPPEHVFAQHLTRLITGRVLNFDARPRSNMAMHMSDYLQQPLLQLGVWPCAEPPRLRLTAVDEQKAASWWARHHLDGARVVALHPGSGSRAKNWPAERFAGLVQWPSSVPRIQTRGRRGGHRYALFMAERLARLAIWKSDKCALATPVSKRCPSARSWMRCR
jgi:heptosyltransferase-3